MGSFANTVFSVLLGWMQGLISMIWSALTDENGGTFFEFIGNNWIKIAVILCIVGLVADFAVYFFRWAPYKVWRTFWRRLRGKRNGQADEPAGETAAETTYTFRGREERTERITPVRTEPEEPDLRRWEPDIPVMQETEETDDLERWRTDETDTAEPTVPAEITRAGYTVPADSPYRRPESRNRRRRLRINLLGDAEENEGEIHYYSPRPMIDQKEAYNAPVYPEKWTGNREQDS